MRVLVVVGFLCYNNVVVVLKVLLMCFHDCIKRLVVGDKTKLCRLEAKLLCSRNHVLCKNQSIGP